MKQTVIDKFRGDHHFLSNFYVGTVGVVHGGRTWLTAEHAYQAAKSSDPDHVDRVLRSRTPADAKRAGRLAKLPDDWDQLRVQVMWEVLLAKFADPELRARLERTRPAVLVEGNSWHDQFWGDCRCVQRQCQPAGANVLGQLLVALRDKICS